MARSLYLRLRRGAAAAWAAANPVLGAGEPSYETDTGLVKIGDGATAYTALGALASQAYASGQDALRLRYQGAWASGTAYALNDLVTYNGGLYVCTTAVSAAAASYVGSCKVNSITAASQNLPLPAGAAAGDFILLAQSDYAGVLIAPAGASTVASAANSNGHYQLVSKVLTSTDITNGYLVIPAQTGANNWAAAGEVFRATTAIDTTTIGQTTTASSPTITPTGAAYVVSISWNLHDTTADGTMTQAALSGFVTQGTPAGTFGACVGMGYDTVASGSSTARAFTTAGNGAVSDSAAIALLTAGFDATKWTFIGNADANLVRTGSVILWTAAAAPTGYLLCDGTSYLRSAYPALYAVIGTLYGTADSTHFNVPDLRARFPLGIAPTFPTLGATGGVTSHSHTLSDAGAAEIYQSVTGYTEARRITLPGGGSFTATTRISGSNATPGSGNTTGAPLTGATDSTAGLYPPYQVMNYIIKT